jgi:SAM-dependent methyltransferase
VKKYERFKTQPVSNSFGFDRGKPIDRYYIENFLEKNKAYIKGHVLEIGDNFYTTLFGQKVTKSDVLNLIPSTQATIVGNLVTGENVPEEVFDCIILTQVIHVIYDIKSALVNTIKALKPGGVLLLTTTGISQNCRSDFHGDYWRFTEMSLNLLLGEIINKEMIEIEHYGNVAIAKAFLDGLALHEIPKKLLEVNDYNYQVVLTAKVKKE